MFVYALTRFFGLANCQPNPWQKLLCLCLHCFQPYNKQLSTNLKTFVLRSWIPYANVLKTFHVWPVSKGYSFHISSSPPGRKRKLGSEIAKQQFLSLHQLIYSSSKDIPSAPEASCSPAYEEKTITCTNSLEVKETRVWKMFKEPVWLEFGAFYLVNMKSHKAYTKDVWETQRKTKHKI